MTQPGFSAAFKDSPMKRAKLRGLERAHAAWALRRLDRDRDAPARLVDTDDAGPDTHLP